MTLSNWADSGSLWVCQYWRVTGSGAFVGASAAGASVTGAEVASVFGACVAAGAEPQAANKVAETINKLINVQIKRLFFISLFSFFAVCTIWEKARFSYLDGAPQLSLLSKITWRKKLPGFGECNFFMDG
jgi:hypothetical protein